MAQGGSIQVISAYGENTPYWPLKNRPRPPCGKGGLIHAVFFTIRATEFGLGPLWVHKSCMEAGNAQDYKGHYQCDR